MFGRKARAAEKAAAVAARVAARQEACTTRRQTLAAEGVQGWPTDSCGTACDQPCRKGR